MDRPCAESLAGLGHSSGSQVTRLVQAPANQDGDADAVWEFEKATPCRSRKQDAVTSEVAVLLRRRRSTRSRVGLSWGFDRTDTTVRLLVKISTGLRAERNHVGVGLSEAVPLRPS